MTEQETTTTPWYITLLVTFAVIGTVLMALWLSRFDTLQTRWQPTPLPIIAQITATPDLSNATPTAVALPSTTPTNLPPTATPSPEAEVSPSATAVAMLPSCGVVADGWVAYRVQAGDSLLYLAANSGATVDEIIQANCLNMKALVSGMTVYLPARPPIRVSCGPPSWWVLYPVQSGDTMYSLATRHNTTVYGIMSANCLSSSYLVAGRMIYLPPAPIMPSATPIPTNTPIPPTPVPPTPVPPTATPTITPEVPTSTPTSTATAVPPSLTPTLTATSSPPTATFTPTPNTPTPTLTATPTTVPPSPTATFTATPEPPTATATAVPPSPTFTATPVPPTPTFTATPIPPTATATATATAVLKP